MSKAKLLAKMTPHGLQVTGVGFGGSGQAITALDVAGALGMSHISRPAYLLGLAKYCGEHWAAGRLWGFVSEEVNELDRKGRWNLTPAQAQGLISLAIREHLHASHCTKCNGSGEIAAKPCDQCFGFGQKTMSSRLRAASAGINRETWRRQRWDARADLVWDAIAMWDSEIYTCLSTHFGWRHATEEA